MKKSEYKRIIKEDFGLVLPDGTINGDPKGKLKPNIKKYKEKESKTNRACIQTPEIMETIHPNHQTT